MGVVKLDVELLKKIKENTETEGGCLGMVIYLIAPKYRKMFRITEV